MHTFVGTGIKKIFEILDWMFWQWIVMVHLSGSIKQNMFMDCIIYKIYMLIYYFYLTIKKLLPMIHEIWHGELIELILSFLFFVYYSIFIQNVYHHSERNHRSRTRQKQEENKFGKYLCVRTWQFGDQTSWGEFWLFCTHHCRPTWRSSFSVNDSVKFLIRQ